MNVGIALSCNVRKHHDRRLRGTRFRTDEMELVPIESANQLLNQRPVVLFKAGTPIRNK